MEETSEWIVGVLVAALGLVGLLLASGALDDEIYLFGLSLAGFGFLFNMMLIKQHYDRKDAQHARARVRHD